MAELATRLFYQRYIGQFHPWVYRLGHVVNGEKSDAYGGQGLHLHTCSPSCPGDCLGQDARKGLVRVKIDPDIGERNRVTKRNQLCRAFRRQNSSHTCDGEHVTLLQLIGSNGDESFRTHSDRSASTRYALGFDLATDVDHPRLPSRVHVRQLPGFSFCHRSRSARSRSSEALTSCGLTLPSARSLAASTAVSDLAAPTAATSSPARVAVRSRS